MLIIRREQNELLAEHQQKRFEERTLLHLKKFWPQQFESMGEEHVRGSIRDGIGRARSHGMATEYDLARFLDLMYSVDTAFDANPAFPWAAQILAEAGLSPREKMDKLYETAERQLKRS